MKRADERAVTALLHNGATVTDNAFAAAIHPERVRRFLSGCVTVCVCVCARSNSPQPRTAHAQLITPFTRSELCCIRALTRAAPTVAVRQLAQVHTLGGLRQRVNRRDAIVLAMVAGGLRNDSASDSSSLSNVLLPSAGAVALFALDERQTRWSAAERSALFGPLADVDELNPLVGPIVHGDVAALQRVLATSDGQVACNRQLCSSSGAPLLLGHWDMTPLWLVCHCASCCYFDDDDTGVELARVLLAAGADPEPPSTGDEQETLVVDFRAFDEMTSGGQQDRQKKWAIGACFNAQVNRDIVLLLLATDKSTPLGRALALTLMLQRAINQGDDMTALFPPALASLPDEFFCVPADCDNGRHSAPHITLLKRSMEHGDELEAFFLEFIEMLDARNVPLHCTGALQLIHIAVHFGFCDAINALARRPDVRLDCRLNRSKEERRLGKTGVIFEREWSNWSLLHFAVLDGEPKSVLALFKLGVDMFARTSDGLCIVDAHMQRLLLDKLPLTVRMALMQLAIELEALNLPVLVLLRIAAFCLPLQAEDAILPRFMCGETYSGVSLSTAWAIVARVREFHQAFN